MFEAFSNVKVSDKTPELKKILADLAKMDVLVGIPEEESGRDEAFINNAELLFIHTNGSPLRNIPARPVIEPAIEYPENKTVIAEDLGKSLEFVMNEDKAGAVARLETAGMLAENLCKDWFDNPNNGWPPNSEATQSRKIAKGSTDPKPLIDTGQLRKSITHVVRET